MPQSKKQLQKNLPKIYSLIEKELSGLKNTVQKETLQAYWRIGKLVNDDLLENENRANYGENLYRTLASTFSASRKTFYRMTQLYRNYPNVSTLTQLSWSHYLQLFSIKDPVKRKMYETLAITRNWTVKELDERIKEDLPNIEDNPKNTIPSLSITRGQLYLMQVVELPLLSGEPGAFLDCGFNVYRRLPKATAQQLKIGSWVENTNNTLSGLKQLISVKERRYTYVGYVEHVVDGDTLKLNIDCGFDYWHSVRVRLRSINAAEAKSKAGQQATDYVTAQLKKAACVIVKTYKTYTRDKYGRYLADIFYLPKQKDPAATAAKGILLNQELLNEGLARPV